MRRIGLPCFQFSCLVAASVFVSGCAMGPDFSRPSAPDVALYDYSPTAETTADGKQNLRMGEDIPSQWWQLFRSKGLNNLIEQAIKDNPDLASAEAALRVALENLSAGGGAFFPTVTGAFGSQRAQKSKVSTGATSIYTLHNASVGVSYNLDVWGGTRRSVEQLAAQAEAARFQKEAAHLSLTANVVTLAVAEAGLREQIAAAKEVIAAQEKILDIVKVRFDAGAVARSAVVAQQSSLASARATLPALQHKLAVTRHALSALVGQLPSKKLLAEFKLSELHLPKDVPLSLPSKLVEQRPDIRAAENNLHAASAAIGVAQAARLPRIVLSADIGTMANVLGKLFSPGGGFWSMGAAATETIFDAGSLAHKEQAAREAYEGAYAQYRKTVLTAFQNVADVLHALQSGAEILMSRREAEKAASENLALVKTQFEAGAVSSADLLLAEQAFHQSKAALAEAQAQRYADTAALFAALGGGWWNRDREDTAQEPAKSGKGSQ